MKDSALTLNRLVPNRICSSSILPTYPICNGHEQRNRRDRRLRKRDDNREENADIVRAVDSRGFLKALRNGEEEVLHDDAVVRAYERRENQREAVIEQAKPLHKQEARDHAGCKNHREQDKDHHDLAAAQARLGKWVSRHRGEQRAQNRTNDRDHERGAKARENLRVIENGFVCIDIEALRIKERTTLKRLLHRAERLHDDMPERIKHDEAEHGDKGVVEYGKDLFTSGGSDFIRMCHFHSLLTRCLRCRSFWQRY